MGWEEGMDLNTSWVLLYIPLGPYSEISLLFHFLILHFEFNNHLQNIFKDTKNLYLYRFILYITKLYLSPKPDMFMFQMSLCIL